MFPHKPAVLQQHVQQPADLVAAFNQLVDGGCLGFAGGTSGPVVDTLVEGELSDLRLKNLGWAWRAGLISDGEAIGLFLCEARRRRDERQDG